MRMPAGPEPHAVSALTAARKTMARPRRLPGSPFIGCHSKRRELGSMTAKEMIRKS